MPGQQICVQQKIVAAKRSRPLSLYLESDKYRIITFKRHFNGTLDPNNPHSTNIS